MKYHSTYYVKKTLLQVKRLLNVISGEEFALQLKKQRKKYCRTREVVIRNTMAEDYVRYIFNANIESKNRQNKIPLPNEEYVRDELDPKLIAYYLPQFHQLEVNNKYHGFGFTEWTNVTQALPVYTGHYQPHIPYDVGFYDILNIETFRRQIYLAKKFGIYGFCFHWYWFSGTRTMEKPLELFLANKDLNINFCLNWANENWSCLWDGGDREIIFKQELKKDDPAKLFEDLLPYFRDERYIKINGRPVFSIYRPSLFGKDDTKWLCSELKKMSKEAGFPDLYILLTNAVDGFKGSAKEWGADAIVEFPPHGMIIREKTEVKLVNPNFNGKIYDLQDYVNKKTYLNNKYNGDIYYRSAMVGFDNTARKVYSGAYIFDGATPAVFETWLTDIIEESKLIHSADNNIVFINSWNEWGEGSHLEPDIKFGYQYLETVLKVLQNTRYKNV